jgi:hypothetical protein
MFVDSFTSHFQFWFLSYVTGSKKIEQQLRAVNSTLHVFGHTHVDRDFVIDGVRYLQQSRKYPREQKYVTSLKVSAYHKACSYSWMVYLFMLLSL